MLGHASSPEDQTTGEQHSRGSPQTVTETNIHEAIPEAPTNSQILEGVIQQDQTYTELLHRREWNDPSSDEEETSSDGPEMTEQLDDQLRTLHPAIHAELRHAWSRNLWREVQWTLFVHDLPQIPPPRRFLCLWNGMIATNIMYQEVLNTTRNWTRICRHTVTSLQIQREDIGQSNNTPPRTRKRKASDRTPPENTPEMEVIPLKRRRITRDL